MKKRVRRRENENLKKARDFAGALTHLRRIYGHLRASFDDYMHLFSSASFDDYKHLFSAVSFDVYWCLLRCESSGIFCQLFASSVCLTACHL